MFILFVFIFFIGNMTGGIVTYIILIKRRMRTTESLNRNINMLNQWLILKQRGIELGHYMNEIHEKKIIIYGFGINGRHLARELLANGINVVAAIDRKKMLSYKNIPVYKIEKCNVEADIIINSVFIEHNSISNYLKKYYNCPILSLEDIVFDSYFDFE